MELPFKLPKVALAGLALIVVLAGLGAWWVLRDGNAVVFDRLTTAQLNSASAELDRAAIPYTIDREKSAIAVASADARRARLAVLASGNALRDSVGFELFDKSDFGMTDFAQKINYQRAMEGEIARTLSALDEIKYARVHLVLPEHTLFRNEKQRPRASVTLFLSQDSGLSAEQVKSVQRITASAVPDLAEQDVTVINQSGLTLSADTTSDTDSAAAPARLAQKKALENYTAEKVRKVLTQALGAGRFAVSVDATLDLNQKTTTLEKVVDAGADAGIKRVKATSSRGKGDAGSEDSSKEIEYALGRESEQVVQSAGAIQHLQVGVIIDNDVGDVDLVKLRELVAVAAGVDAARGDKVAVVQNSIAVQKVLSGLSAAGAAAQVAPEPTARAWPLAAMAALLLLGICGGALLVWLLRPRRGRALNEIELQRLRQELQQWINSEPVHTEFL